MENQKFKDKLEILIILSDIMESVTIELDNQINDPILQFKVRKTRTSVTALNRKLQDFINYDVQVAMGDYIDNARETLENYIENFNREKK